MSATTSLRPPPMRPDPMDVSRETNEALARYGALLRKWQGAINLVSASTLDEAWQRHFLDSLQLLPLLGDAKTLYDLGSGAGFPGMVLAIARPDLAVSLVESDGKKCSFLRTVSRETGTKVEIVNARIEALEPERPVDIITARALASLSDLLTYVQPLMAANPRCKLLFLKGVDLEREVAAAQERFDFEMITHPSQTSADGLIAEITNLTLKI